MSNEYITILETPRLILRKMSQSDSNAGSYYFEDFSDLRDLDKIDWQKEAAAFLTHCDETSLRIDRVSKAVEGFETQFGLELLSTVHWVAKNETQELESIVDHVYSWSPQKRKFSPRQIGIAAERLSKKGWITILA